MVSGFRFRVSVLGFQFSVFGFSVSGFGFLVSGFGFLASGNGFMVSGFEFRVQDESVTPRSRGSPGIHTERRRHVRFSGGGGVLRHDVQLIVWG